MDQASPSIVLITGQAGAGHSTALKILEDEGYITVDNLPLALVDQLVAIEVEMGGRDLAFCLDARTSGFDTDALTRLITNLKAKFNDNMKVVHLTASRSEITRRFLSTRRLHPLAKEHMIEEAILLDQERMSDLLPLANVAIDSTAISPTALRQALLDGLHISGQDTLTVQVISFAYKNGIPENADYVFDIRFLRNPHWEPDLRALTGQDEKVAVYVTTDQAFDRFVSHLTQMSSLILDRASRDGRPHLTFAFGCTGGKHRSVAVASVFGEWARTQGHSIQITHRELPSA